LFELGISLSFYDGRGNSEVVVFEGVMSDGLTHTVRRQDGTRLQVHDAHLCLKLQADLSNIPKTPLDYLLQRGWQRYLKRRSRGTRKATHPHFYSAGVNGLASLPLSSLLPQDFLIG
jgi:hypothetical protein